MPDTAPAPAPAASEAPPPAETVSIPKADAEALTALRTRYTPPEKYDLKLPEGSKLDASLTERTAAIARKLGLSQPDAAELFNSVHGEITAREAAQAAANEPGKGTAWLARDKEWQAAALKDPDIGGSPEKLAASAELGKRVLDHYKADEVKDFLAETGLGSHPAIVKFLAQIGRSMKEADFVRAPGDTGSKKDERTPAQRMYPTHAKKEE